MKTHTILPRLATWLLAIAVATSPALGGKSGSHQGTGRTPAARASGSSASGTQGAAAKRKQNQAAGEAKRQKPIEERARQTAQEVDRSLRNPLPADAALAEKVTQLNAHMRARLLEVSASQRQIDKGRRLQQSAGGGGGADVTYDRPAKGSSPAVRVIKELKSISPGNLDEPPMSAVKRAVRDADAQLASRNNAQDARLKITVELDPNYQRGLDQKLERIKASSPDLTPALESMIKKLVNDPVKPRGGDARQVTAAHHVKIRNALIAGRKVDLTINFDGTRSTAQVKLRNVEDRHKPKDKHPHHYIGSIDLQSQTQVPPP